MMHKTDPLAAAVTHSARTHHFTICRPIFTGVTLLAWYMIWLCICASVTSQSSVKMAEWIDLVFWHSGYQQLILHCVIRKFGYFQ